MVDKDKRLEGIIVPILTPLNKDETLDEKGFQKLLQYVLEGGVHGVFVLGTAGEFPAFDYKERERIVEIAMEEINGKIPVLVGTSDPSTRQVIEHIRRATKVGVDAVVVCPPYYYPLTQEEIIIHYTTIANHSKLPIIIYNIPSTTKVTIETKTVLTIVERSRIVGVKDSSGNFNSFLELLAFIKSKIPIFQGIGSLTAVSIICGAAGGVMAVANLMPRETAYLYRLIQEKKFEEAMVLQEKINKISRIFKSQSTHAGLKMALSLKGICSPYVAKPISPVSKENEAKIKKVLKESNLS